MCPRRTVFLLSQILSNCEANNGRHISAYRSGVVCNVCDADGRICMLSAPRNQNGINTSQNGVVISKVLLIPREITRNALQQYENVESLIQDRPFLTNIYSCPSKRRVVVKKRGRLDECPPSINNEIIRPSRQLDDL